MLTVQQVHTARERHVFARLARDVYQAESSWIRPLDGIVVDYLDSRRNPFYRHGVGRAFLVRRDESLVGRILVHVWHRHNHLHQERVGYFGFFECHNDAEAAGFLLEEAAAFARLQGCEILRGPFNMTAAQEMGIVTSGFDSAPAIDMVYTPPWYPALLEAAGFRRCLAMQTWLNPDIGPLDPEAICPPRHRARLEALRVRIRPLSRWQRRADLEHARELTNAAFLGNWCFVPITPEEWDLQVGPVIPLLDPALILLAEVQGVPIGVTYAVPDYNRILRRLNGSLVHPRALALLRRPPTDAALIILFAVRKQYQRLGVSRALNAELVRAMRRRSYRSLAVTWVAETNVGSQRQMEALGMRPLHDLAMYERSLL